MSTVSIPPPAGGNTSGSYSAADAKAAILRLRRRRFGSPFSSDGQLLTLDPVVRLGVFTAVWALIRSPDRIFHWLSGIVHVWSSGVAEAGGALAAGSRPATSLVQVADRRALPRLRGPAEGVHRFASAPERGWLRAAGRKAHRALGHAGIFLATGPGRAVSGATTVFLPLLLTSWFRPLPPGLLLGVPAAMGAFRWGFPYLDERFGLTHRLEDRVRDGIAGMIGGYHRVQVGSRPLRVAAARAGGQLASAVRSVLAGLRAGVEPLRGDVAHLRDGLTIRRGIAWAGGAAILLALVAVTAPATVLPVTAAAVMTSGAVTTHLLSRQPRSGSGAAARTTRRVRELVSRAGAAVAAWATAEDDHSAQVRRSWAQVRQLRRREVRDLARAIAGPRQDLPEQDRPLHLSLERVLRQTVRGSRGAYRFVDPDAAHTVGAILGRLSARCNARGERSSAFDLQLSAVAPDLFDAQAAYAVAAEVRQERQAGSITARWADLQPPPPGSVDIRAGDRPQLGDARERAQQTLGTAVLTDQDMTTLRCVTALLMDAAQTGSGLRLDTTAQGLMARQLCDWVRRTQVESIDLDGYEPQTRHGLRSAIATAQEERTQQVNKELVLRRGLDRLTEAEQFENSRTQRHDPQGRQERRRELHRNALWRQQTPVMSYEDSGLAWFMRGDTRTAAPHPLSHPRPPAGVAGQRQAPTQVGHAAARRSAIRSSDIGVRLS